LQKKALIPTVVCIILLVVSIGGNLWLWTSLNQANSEIASLETTIDTKNSEIETLESQVDELRLQYNLLNTSYTWLKQHSFTYYTVGDAINISNVGIFEEWFYWTINGTITNISDKPIETVYVYLILRNPDGTAVFNTWDYEEIKNLYIGETEPFEFSVYEYDESQTVEIFLVY